MAIRFHANRQGVNFVPHGGQRRFVLTFSRIAFRCFSRSSSIWSGDNGNSCSFSQNHWLDPTVAPGKVAVLGRLNRLGNSGGRCLTFHSEKTPLINMRQACAIVPFAAQSAQKRASSGKNVTSKNAPPTKMSHAASRPACAFKKKIPFATTVGHRCDVRTEWNRMVRLLGGIVPW